MQKYLIKSMKWTKHYGQDTYWGPNQTGYTHMIIEAGVYSKEEAEKILQHSSLFDTSMIPITRELLDKAAEQLHHRRKDLLESLDNADRDHELFKQSIIAKNQKVDEQFSQLESLANSLEVVITYPLL